MFWLEKQVSIYCKDKHCRKEDRFFMCECGADVQCQKGIVKCSCGRKYRITSKHILENDTCFSGTIEIKKGIIFPKPILIR